MKPKASSKPTPTTITLAVACTSGGREFFGSPDGAEFRRLSHFPITYQEAAGLIAGSANGIVTIAELQSRYRCNLAVMQLIE